MDGLPPDGLEGLTPGEREWARHSEALWQRAHAVAVRHTGVDAGDVITPCDVSPWRRPSGSSED